MREEASDGGQMAEHCNTPEGRRSPASLSILLYRTQWVNAPFNPSFGLAGEAN